MASGAHQHVLDSVGAQLAALCEALEQHAHALLAAAAARLQLLVPGQQQVDAVAQAAMQQWLAATACVASLGLLLATIAAGWLALWHTTMKDVGFFREIMGLNRPKPEVKAQRQASMTAEIEKIKRQHSRSSARSFHSSSGRPA